MRKTVIAICMALTLVKAGAEELKTLSKEDLDLLNRNYSSLSSEEQAKRRELSALRALIEDGGRMPYPGTPRGKVVIANLQKRVGQEKIEEVRRSFTTLMGYDLLFVDKETAGEIVIRIVDKPGERALTVWPDESQAQINVAALSADSPKPAFLSSRVRKEILRGFACLTAGSTYELGLYNKIKTLKDLDEIAIEEFPVDIIMRTTSFMKSAGVVPARTATYRSVLELGYDVAPTNGYQKAIYEEVKKTTKLYKKLP